MSRDTAVAVLCVMVLLTVTLASSLTNPFEAREATVQSVHASLFSGSNSCRDIVSAFVARIEALNPIINAVIALNPSALSEADLRDDMLSRGNATGALYCIPILLKDNFDAVGMATTAGSLTLDSLRPAADAPAVTAFRRAGAVILGKTNLHEFALEGLTISSLGGQTLNPYDISRTPGGSSGGTGAAIAASFAVFGTGTDTVNSLRSPASANSLYSFRPTRGLISRAGVVPVSYSQDTVGAIGRTLEDIAIALRVMTSSAMDPADNTTDARPSDIARTFWHRNSAPPAAASLSQMRIGVLDNFIDHAEEVETIPVTTHMANVVFLLEKYNTTILHINDTSTFDAARLLGFDLQQYEYREQLTSYLESPHLHGPHPRSMDELYSANSSFLVIPHQSQYIRTALNASTSSPEYVRRKRCVADLKTALHKIMTDNQLDAIIYPQQRNLVVPVGSRNQHGRNGILAALTGSPVITIPIGFSNASDSAPLGIPIGMEILGMPWSEEKLLDVARAIDEKLRARKAPITAGLNETVEVNKWYDKMPEIHPWGLRQCDSVVYPPGVF